MTGDFVIVEGIVVSSARCAFGLGPLGGSVATAVFPTAEQMGRSARAMQPGPADVDAATP